MAVESKPGSFEHHLALWFQHDSWDSKRIPPMVSPQAASENEKANVPKTFSQVFQEFPRYLSLATTHKRNGTIFRRHLCFRENVWRD